MNIYVGNLPFDTGDEDLRQLYEQYGEVSSSKVIMDQMSGRSRGFGFVEMPSQEEGAAAVSATNGADFGGRSLKVAEAQPRDDRRPPRQGGGGGGGGRRY